MKRLVLLAAVASAFALSGCYRNDTTRAVDTANYDNSKSWHVTCQGYGGVLFDGDTRGPTTYDETGRVSFIDRSTGKLVKSEGECVQTEL